MTGIIFVAIEKMKMEERSEEGAKSQEKTATSEPIDMPGKKTDIVEEELGWYLERSRSFFLVLYVIFGAFRRDCILQLFTLILLRPILLRFR